MKCELCGIQIVNGTYRFSFKPDQPVLPNLVYTRICKSAIEAEAKRKAAGETDLSPIALHKCINSKGVYNPKYRWLEPNEVA